MYNVFLQSTICFLFRNSYSLCKHSHTHNNQYIYACTWALIHLLREWRKKIKQSHVHALDTRERINCGNAKHTATTTHGINEVCINRYECVIASHFCLSRMHILICLPLVQTNVKCINRGAHIFWVLYRIFVRFVYRSMHGLVEASLFLSRYFSCLYMQFIVNLW